jgi:hypothetical protein
MVIDIGFKRRLHIAGSLYNIGDLAITLRSFRVFDSGKDNVKLPVYYI